IHGGGIDLVFPHHENEVAQSRCAFHTPIMAQVWMHNGFLQVEGEKMAKSVGNFVTIREVLSENWGGDAVRLAMLMTNYRQPINWTETRLSEAQAKLGIWGQAVRSVDPSRTRQPVGVIAALSDDLNTWAAVVEMDRLAKDSMSPHS